MGLRKWTKEAIVVPTRTCETILEGLLATAASQASTGNNSPHSFLCHAIRGLQAKTADMEQPLDNRGAEIDVMSKSSIRRCVHEGVL